jgi:hypothetical protein
MFQPLVSDGWAAGHGDCDGIMKRDDRIVGNLPRQLMEAMICGPVGRISALGPNVDRGDRGLDLVLRAGGNVR